MFQYYSKYIQIIKISLEPKIIFFLLYKMQHKWRKSYKHMPESYQVLIQENSVSTLFWCNFTVNIHTIISLGVSADSVMCSTPCMHRGNKKGHFVFFFPYQTRPVLLFLGGGKLKIMVMVPLKVMRIINGQKGCNDIVEYGNGWLIYTVYVYVYV